VLLSHDRIAPSDVSAVFLDQCWESTAEDAKDEADSFAGSALTHYYPTINESVNLPI